MTEENDDGTNRAIREQRRNMAVTHTRESLPDGYFFLYDLETTGISVVSDKVVEIAYFLVRQRDGEAFFVHRSLHNPGKMISPEAIEAHGIRDEDVAHEPPLSLYRRQLEAHIGGAMAVVGFNHTKFDNYILDREMKEMGSDVVVSTKPQVDILTLLSKVEPRTLEGVYSRIVGRELVGAHQAEVDVAATLQIYNDLKRMAGMENSSVSEISGLLSNGNITGDGRVKWNDELCPVFDFGKYGGMKISDIVNFDPGYIDWILDKADPEKFTWITPDLKLILRFARELRGYPEALRRRIIVEFGTPHHKCLDFAEIEHEVAYDPYYGDGPEVVQRSPLGLSVPDLETDGQ